MIIRDAKRFTFVLVVMLVIFAWLLKLININQLQQQVTDNTQYQATIISSVSLLLSEHDLNVRQELSAVLQSLDNIKGLTGWQLVDSNGHILSETPSYTDNRISSPQNLSYQHTLYFKKSENQFLTLRMAIQSKISPKKNITGLEYLVLLGLLASILLTGFYLFRWLYQIESYARYILANESEPARASIEKSTNPINQTINQLLLKNNLLLKDKTDLTEQIRKVSFIDEQTELGNYLFFKAEFEVRLHNHEEAESGLLMLLSFNELDQNNQLMLNEERVLAIANLLRHFIAEIPNGLVARLKGFDFALLIPYQSRKTIDSLCKKLILQLEKIVFDKTNLRDHFIDIGVSAYKQGFDYYKILAEADMALRNAQLQGANNWYIYGEDLAADKIRGNIRWRSFLQQVLEKRQIQLFGQRIHYFQQQDMEHIEIYSRVKDGETLLTAETFLPMANHCGLTVEFDRQIIDGLIKHCLFKAQDKPKTIYTINLFINSLLDQKFINWLVKKLSSYPTLCQQLYFEIKEIHVNQNLPLLKKIFPQLAGLGLSWSIDKFGSPDENQTFLDVLPIKRVKLDRRIVHNIHAEKTQQLLLQSLLINLKSKNIEVYADGVEKEEDAKFLLKSGIAGAQGFYYGNPERLRPIEKQLKANG